MLLGRTQAVPQEAMLGPTRAYPKSRGLGGGGLPTPGAPVTLAPVCILQVFHFSGLTLLFQERHVSSLSVSNS